MIASDLDLLELQVEALFTHDAQGRIVSVNEPGGGPAPRLFFGRTTRGNVWRVRNDLPVGIAERLAALASGEPLTTDLQAMPRHLDAMLAILAEVSPAAVGHAGPAYCFPDDLDVPTGVTRITRENRHLLRAMPDYLDDVERGLDAYEPRFAVVADGVAVAICTSARLTDHAAEAGVDTLPGYRGRGYAPMVVAAWARAIRESGRTPLYSTAWDNLASRAVARKLGLVQYGSDLSLT